MGNVALPRPIGGRSPRGAYFLYIPQLCGLSCSHCVCKRSLDECWWLLGVPNHPQPVLALCFSLHRLCMYFSLPPILSLNTPFPPPLPSPFTVRKILRPANTPIASIRLPWHDGKRIWLPHLWLWLRMPMYVSIQSRIRVQDRRQSCLGAVRLPRRRRRKMGRNHVGDFVWV